MKSSVSGQEESSEEEHVKISKEFQENVIKYVKYDDLIKEKQKEIKELRDKKKPCEKYILKYLDDVDENMIEITGGKLRKNTSETKIPLNQTVIEDALKEKVKDEKTVKEIFELMDKKRPKNVRVNLKRTSQRKRVEKKKT